MISDTFSGKILTEPNKGPYNVRNFKYYVANNEGQRIIIDEIAAASLARKVTGNALPDPRKTRDYQKIISSQQDETSPIKAREMRKNFYDQIHNAINGIEVTGEAIDLSRHVLAMKVEPAPKR